MSKKDFSRKKRKPQKVPFKCCEKKEKKRYKEEKSSVKNCRNVDVKKVEIELKTTADKSSLYPRVLQSVRTVNPDLDSCLLPPPV